MSNANEVKELLDDMATNFDTFKKNHEQALATERKEREALEARMNRLGLAGGFNAKTTNAGPEMKALDKLIRTGDDAEFKAMSVGVDPDGGYTVTPVFSEGMTTRLFDLSPMRRLSRVEGITVGDAFSEIDDRGEASATWVSEKEARTKGATPKLGTWEIPVNEIYSLQPVTQRLLDDSNRDIGSWICGI